ncbi:MAG: hypothetical protein ACRD0A_11930 [Acidimicrobiales bacterium]
MTDSHGQELAGLLLAEGAYPEHAAELMTFGQFVGGWDMTVQFYDATGARVFDGVGEWQFGWVLDGRAIQDVLHYGEPSSSPRTAPDRQLGTTLRYLDPTSGTWTITWLGTTSGICIQLRGGDHGDGTLRLEGIDVDGSSIRWSFSDITQTSFTWSGETRRGSDPWRVEQAMTARRRS